MKPQPKISVVMTSYNHHEYVGIAIESIIHQTFSDFELIIVDDNSTDGSQNIIREYESKDTRIKATYRTENFGNYVLSTNYGASLASGDYLVFTQCDDYAEPMQLEMLYGARKNNPGCGVVFSISKMIDEKGELLNYDYNLRSRRFQKYAKESCVLERKIATRFLLKECIIPNLSAAMVDRSLYNQVHGLSPKYKVLADWDFWIKCALTTNFFYMKEPLNNFRQHNTTIRNTIKIEIQLNELYSIFSSYNNKIVSRHKLNIAVGSIFWGVIQPLTFQNILKALKLAFNSIEFSILEPLYIYYSLCLIFIKKIIRFFQ